MSNLSEVKNYLAKRNITNQFEKLPNGEHALTFEIQMTEKRGFVVQPIQNTNILRVYTIFAIASPKAKHNVCRLINDYNQKCRYIKFFYQESFQGTFVMASYTMPALTEGLEYFFGEVLNAFISQLDSIVVPCALFQGDIESWYWGD